MTAKVAKVAKVAKKRGSTRITVGLEGRISVTEGRRGDDLESQVNLVAVAIGATLE